MNSIVSTKFTIDSCIGPQKLEGRSDERTQCTYQSTHAGEPSGGDHDFGYLGEGREELFVAHPQVEATQQLDEGL